MIHPKVQIQRKMDFIKYMLITEDFTGREDFKKDLEKELEIWKEIIIIIRTYEVTDTVRERLIRTQTLRIDPPI